ncbi:MAG: LysE family translocator [Pseudomonadota bacterium]
MGTAELLSTVLAFFVVAVSPGPANIAVATVAMSSGRRRGLTFGLGLGLGLAFWGVVAATGMGAVLQGSATLLTGLKILGGLYLIWLAIQSARSAARPVKTTAQQPREGRWLLRGVLLNLSNPKAVVAWMATLSMGLEAGESGNGLLIATALCMALGFLNYAGYALTFSLPGFMAAYDRLRRWVDGVVAALFATAGLGLIKSAFSR